VLQVIAFTKKHGAGQLVECQKNKTMLPRKKLRRSGRTSSGLGGYIYKVLECSKDPLFHVPSIGCGSQDKRSRHPVRSSTIYKFVTTKTKKKDAFF